MVFVAKYMCGVKIKLKISVCILASGLTRRQDVYSKCENIENVKSKLLEYVVCFKISYMHAKR